MLDSRRWLTFAVPLRRVFVPPFFEIARSSSPMPGFSGDHSIDLLKDFRLGLPLLSMRYRYLLSRVRCGQLGGQRCTLFFSICSMALRSDRSEQRAPAA